MNIYLVPIVPPPISPTSYCCLIMITQYSLLLYNITYSPLYHYTPYLLFICSSFCNDICSILEISGMRLALPDHIRGLPVRSINAYDCSETANDVSLFASEEKIFVYECAYIYLYVF